MKKIFNSISVLLSLAFVWTGCTQYTEYGSDEAGSVETLLYPSDGFELTLINNDNAKLAFEWEPSETGSPLYEVIIYGSDAATEIGRFESDDNGTRNMMTLPQKTLIELADIAGIGPEETGDLYWTVVAISGGSVQATAPSPNKIVVTRDATVVGFPSELYVTGAGSEAGEDVSNAYAMDEISDGVFEIYTELDGAFSLVNRNAEGSKRTFYLAEGGKMTTDAESAVSADAGIYRMTADFNTNTLTLVSVTDVALYRANGDRLTDMEYAGNGSWKAENYTIPTDGDDRYRFRAVAAGNDEVWGSANTDRDAQDPGTVDPENAYFNIAVYSGEDAIGDSYRSIFKFHSPIKGMECSVVVSMNGGRAYHYFDFGFDLVAPVVETLVAPAEGASVELQSIEGASETFSWEKPAECPQLSLTTYTLKFYSDAEGTAEIGSFNASYNNSISLAHTDLETVATAAGIASASEGTVYWGVQTTLISSTALSPVRSLNVTRMKGVPTELYITGEASEFGSGFGQMKNIATGQFEIFTRLSSGNYAFTDAASDDARKFVIDGTAFKESQSEGTWSDESIYRITVDVMAGTAKVEKIGRVYMQVAAYKENTFDLPYIGNGIWEADNIVPDFTREASWNGDTRFFVKMDIDGKEWKLANQKDFGGSDPTDPAPEGSSEYAVKFWDDTSDWDYHYKVIQSYRGQNTKALNIKLNCSPQAEFYYVYLEYLDL